MIEISEITKIPETYDNNKNHENCIVKSFISKSENLIRFVYFHPRRFARQQAFKNP